MKSRVEYRQIMNEPPNRYEKLLEKPDNHRIFSKQRGMLNALY